MINILEKILNHQQHLHFNVPYGPDDVSNPGWAAHYGAQCYAEECSKNDSLRKELEELHNRFNNLWDIPIQTELGENFPFTGYIGYDGEIIKCDSCEHEKIVRDILYNNPEYFKRYKLTPASYFDRKPQGMLQEEYFLMRYLGFVKISSFAKAPTKRILFRYENLTWRQTDVIYPR